MVRQLNYTGKNNLIYKFKNPLYVKEYSKNTSKFEIEVDKAPYVLIVVMFIFGIFLYLVQLIIN